MAEESEIEQGAPASADAAEAPPSDLIACALFCSIVSATMVLLHAVARSGLNIHAALLLATAAIAMAVMFAPVLFGGLARTKAQWISWTPAVITIALLFPALGQVLKHWAIVPMAAVAAVGIALALRRRHGLRNHWGLAIFAAPALAVLYFLWLNGSAFGHLYQFEYAQLGRLYLDNVFHAAIAEMIRNFGVASIGADGVAPLPYHVGSHTWIAAVANMVQAPAIIVYPVALQIIGIPCFLFAFLLAAHALPPQSAAGASRVIPVAVACIVGASWLIWDKLLLSESYVFSLIPFLAGLPLLISILLEPKEGVLRDKLRLAVAVALLPVIFWFKIAVGVIWAVGLGYVIARAYIIGRTRFALPLLAGGAVVGIALLLAVAAYYAPVRLLDMIRPFDFQRLYPIHFVADLAISLAAIAVLHFDAALSSRERRLQIELLAVLAISSNLPGSIFALDNAAYYFINASTWVSLAVLVSRGAIHLQNAEPRYPKARAYLIAGILALVLLDPARWKSTFLFIDRVASLQALGDSGALPAGPYEKRGLRQAAQESWQQLDSFAGLARGGPLFPATVAGAIERSTGGHILREVAAAKSRSSGPIVVSVRPANLDFWRMNADCRAQPMLLPALAGTPMLMGLPPAEAGCDVGVQYGFAGYDADSVARALGDGELCARAALGDFKAVLVLEERNGAQAGTLISCP